jgi:hypothetical protein
MVGKRLSFDFKFSYSKLVMIIISILVSLAVLTFSILFMMWGTEKKFEVFCITVLYCLASCIFDYFLIRSKDVLYDEERLYVSKKKEGFVELPFNQIKEIKRVFFYFYRISFHEKWDMIGNEVYFYISPYPSIFKLKEIKEIMSCKK